MNGEDKIKNISSQIKLNFEKLGLEHHAFKIGWYNECVTHEYHLNYDYNTLAYVIISSPHMFDQAFLPFIRTHENTLDHLRDPIDQCMIHHFNHLKQSFGDEDIDMMFDFEMKMPSRKPKVLVQTAAHVSGAAYYYKPIDNPLERESSKERMIGVCLHPKYSGWFAIRGIIVFKNVTTLSLPKKLPVCMINSDQELNKLLRKFNFEWQDWSYRDILPSICKYSSLQIQYFNTKPSDRRNFLREKLIDQTDLLDQY